MAAGDLMAAEMAEQPSVLRALLEQRDVVLRALGHARPHELAGVIVLARGSSNHAAIYGRYVLELATGRPVALAAPSLHTRYRADTDYSGYLALGIDESGRTPEIVDVLGEMSRAGARTVALSSESESPLAVAADVCVELRAGVERAVPATKCFTAQLAAIALVAEGLGPVPWAPGELQALPDQLERLLDAPDAVRPAIDLLYGAQGVIHVGRGFLYGPALEGALQMRETTGLLSEGYSAADFLHGPVAVAGSGLVVVAYACPGPALADVAAVTAATAERHAAVVAIVPEGEPLPGASVHLRVERTSEALTPLLHSVRAQQLSYVLARARGVNPDEPFGLTKGHGTALSG